MALALLPAHPTTSGDAADEPQRTAHRRAARAADPTTQEHTR